VAAAPSVRKLAREIGIDVTQVPGSGPHGRISVDDVKAYSKQLNEGRAAAPAAAGPAALPLPDFSLWGEIERVPMNTIRRMTVEHMERCWSAVPHVTQQHKADITELEKLRKRHGKKAEDAGGKLTPTAILLKVVASALKVFKEFNASIDTAGNEIVYKQYVNVGVAVDTPNGLVVPVIRDADRKNIIELAVELSEMAAKMRDGNISPKDIAGGNFTLSNIGGIGGSYFTPIVNTPEVGILGVGRAATEAVYINGAFEPRLMLPLSLSYDHRLIDGATGARFMQWIVDAINEPLMLALEG
jgi:pyruvate dehydrogenase E2 component (dihydrolipoamide acetyltransferase)